MAEQQGGKRQQPTTCPEGWLPAAVVVQLELTCRQGHYAQRCVGIARFVYNRMVANDQAGRDIGLWLTPHELEKEFNAAKHINPSLAFVTQASKFVAQGACRNYRNARSRWLNKEVKARRPVFHRKNRTGTGSFLAASGVDRIRYDGHRRMRCPT
ncbi:MAG: helix-turn-helix domain-containing protein [Chloroflexota bacterium]|nr:helix-turn-helix domain-containing protein [Chloroflexota bacterium]